jgi:hypothetical protein
MAQVRKWSNVAVSMQSVLAAAITISSITKAAPGVVTTSAAHGLANGDYVLLNIQGMYQLNGKVFRAINASGSSLQFEDVSGGTGIDTTAFDTFASGTLQKITFGTNISSIAEITAGGGDFDFLDTTTIHVNQKNQIPGTANALEYTMSHLWDITDAGQIAMKTASDAQAQRAFKFTFGTGGPIMVFTGYVGYVGVPTGSAQDKIVSPATVTAFGTPTYYSA